MIYNVLTGIILSRCALEENKSALVIDLLDKFGWPDDWPEFYAEIEKIFKSSYRGHRIGYLNFESLISQGPDANQASVSIACDLLKNMLRIKPRDRFTWIQVLQHPFWTLGIESQKPVKDCVISYPSDYADASTFLKNSQFFESGCQDSALLLKQQSDYVSDRTVYVDSMFTIIDVMIAKSKIFGFGESTSFYAICIMECAIFNGLKCESEVFSACLFLSSAFNEDIRMHNFSWTTWTSTWDRLSLTNCSKRFARCALRVLITTRGYWPRVSWLSVFLSMSKHIKNLLNEELHTTTALYLLACPLPEIKEELNFVLLKLKKLST